MAKRKTSSRRPSAREAKRLQTNNLRRARDQRLHQAMLASFTPPLNTRQELTRLSHLASFSQKLQFVLSKALTPTPRRPSSPAKPALASTASVSFGPEAHLKEPTICARRSTRRVTLFAMNIAGKSGGSPGKNHTYKRSPDSERSC